MPHPTQNKSIKQKVFWHLKVLAGAVFISLFFSLVLQQKLFHPQLLQLVTFTFVQLEIFIWLGVVFFQSLEIGTPRFKTKMLFRLALFYFSVLFIALLFYLLLFTYYFLKNNSGFQEFFPMLFNNEMKNFFVATLIGFSLGTLFFFYVQWDEALKREQKLTKEKLIFQNETLKSQINPHFLFNSLNTLSSLVSTNPGLSEEYIRKLSSVYRYVLENMEKELVPVQDELDFVNEYFYLQKIRNGEKISLKTEIPERPKGLIPPVSVQMLVENAVKHNTASRKEPLEIVIHFEGIDKLVVRNHLQKRMQLGSSSKIGLKNLNERCRLILNREIEVQETGDEFVVKLPVKIG